MPTHSNADGLDLYGDFNIIQSNTDTIDLASEALKKGRKHKRFVTVFLIWSENCFCGNLLLA